MEQKETKIHVMLDMDGVLANFVKGCEEVFDADLSGLQAFGINEYLGIGTDEFWKRIEQKEDFWLALQPYPWTQELVEMLLEETSSRVTICTTPSFDADCARQKLLWMRTYLRRFNRAFLIGPEKHLLAKPNHILIDDYDKNIEAFRAAGGKAILFPQPWNRCKRALPDYVIVNYIRDEIREIISNLEDNG